MICRKGEPSKKYMGDKRNVAVVVRAWRFPIHRLTAAATRSEQFDFGEVLRVDQADGVAAAIDDDQVADAVGFE